MASDIQERITALEAELKSLKIQIASKNTLSVSDASCCNNQASKHLLNKCNLSNKDIQRYSRQIILPEVSVQGIAPTLFVTFLKINLSIAKY